VERKDHVRVDEGHVIHVEGAGEPGEEGTHRQGEAFIAEGTDSHGFGSILVFADGNKIVAPFGIDHPVDNVKLAELITRVIGTEIGKIKIWDWDDVVAETLRIYRG
jgi:hypothetical protein